MVAGGGHEGGAGQSEELLRGESGTHVEYGNSDAQQEIEFLTLQLRSQVNVIGDAIHQEELLHCASDEATNPEMEEGV